MNSYNVWENIFWLISANTNDQLFSISLHKGLLMRSTDYGKSWERIDNGLLVKNYLISGFPPMVDSLHFSPNGDYYATIFRGGIYRSTNRGESWRRVLESNCLHSLTINSSGHIFFGAGEGTFRSTNNLLSFSRLEKLDTAQYLVVRPNGNIYALTLENKLFYSIDNGNQWDRLSCIYSPTSLAINGQEHIYLNSWYRGIFISTNKGRNFNKLTSLSSFGQILCANGFIFHRMRDKKEKWGLFRTEDNKDNWVELLLNGFGEPECKIDNLIISPNGHLFTTNNYKIFRSLDNGDTWEQMN